MVAVLISFIFYNQHLDQDGVMNINGALFMCISNMTFQNVLAVINVSIGRVRSISHRHKLPSVCVCEWKVYRKKNTRAL